MLTAKKYIDSHKNAWELYDHPLYLEILAKVSSEIVDQNNEASLWLTSDYLDDIEKTFSDIEMLMRHVQLDYHLNFYHEVEDNYKSLILNINIHDENIKELCTLYHLDYDKVIELQKLNDLNSRFYFVKYLFLNDIVQAYLLQKDAIVLTISNFYNKDFIISVLDDLDVDYDKEFKQDIHEQIYTIKVNLSNLK